MKCPLTDWIICNHIVEKKIIKKQYQGLKPNFGTIKLERQSYQKLIFQNSSPQDIGENEVQRVSSLDVQNDAVCM